MVFLPAHASVQAISNYFDRRYGGFSLRKELTFLYEVIENPDRPVGAILGGVKISTKLPLLHHLLDKVDVLCIGGAMVFTLYRALGHDVGDSIIEEDMIEAAGNLLREAASRDVIIRIATDVVIANTGQLHATPSRGQTDALVLQTVSYDAIPHGWVGLDVGKQTITDFEEQLYQCHTLIWNGPLGKIEDERFAGGTRALLSILSNCTDRGLTTIACGGDTTAAIEKFGPARFSHISLGGGAALQLISGEQLPGIDAISAKPEHPRSGEVKL